MNVCCMYTVYRIPYTCFVLLRILVCMHPAFVLLRIFMYECMSSAQAARVLVATAGMYRGMVLLVVGRLLFLCYPVVGAIVVV